MKLTVVFLTLALFFSASMAFSQSRGALVGPYRDIGSSRRVILETENKLKDALSEPVEELSTLTDRAAQNNPQALYALSQVCKEKGMREESSKYLLRAAELGYTKAQLRVAIDWYKTSLDVEKLKTAKRYCMEAINAGYLSATNVLPFIERAILERSAAEIENLRKNDEREQFARQLRIAQERSSGISTPLIPFFSMHKIGYEEAMARAKANDGEAFYWLAYYFLKGEGVEENREAAGKFLQKAVDAGNPQACYLVGLYHAYVSLVDELGQNGFGGWNKLLPKRDCDETAAVLRDAKMNYGIDSLQIHLENRKGKGTPSLGGLHSRSLLGHDRIAEYCFTNDVATGYVLGLYSKAVEGGLSYATNDIVRLNMAIAKCRERIAERTAAENAAKEKGGLALALLEGEGAGREKAEKNDDHSRQQEELKRQREYWSTWPKVLDDDDLSLLGADFEQKFNCVFFDSHAQTGPQPSSLLRRPRRSTLIPEPIRMPQSTNTWVRGCGKSLLIVQNNGASIKIDADGQLVAYGLCVMAEELCWYDAEKLKRLDAKRSKWAKERGMTLEGAERKYMEWQDGGLVNSFAARDAERAEKSRQLQSIREELRRARERQRSAQE